MNVNTRTGELTQTSQNMYVYSS